VLTSNPQLDTLSLTLVDGFAGGGQYSFQGATALGSPMILLQEVACAQARLTHARRKVFKLNAEFVFVERSPRSKAFLEHTIRATEHGQLLDKSVHLLGGQFEHELPGIIQRIRTRNRAQRSIFFLDQYGYNQVSLETIRTILTSLENPEIIVTFNVDSLIAYLNEDDDFLKGVKPVELDQGIVKQMLAMKDQSEGRWLIQNMLFRHLRDKTGAPFYTCFFIKSPASHRSYWLIHIFETPESQGRNGAETLGHVESFRPPRTGWTQNAWIRSGAEHTANPNEFLFRRRRGNPLEVCFDERASAADI
jgi:three-Cys-motif partner protein